jgi:hypothetical protein
MSPVLQIVIAEQDWDVLLTQVQEAYASASRSAAEDARERLDNAERFFVCFRASSWAFHVVFFQSFFYFTVISVQRCYGRWGDVRDARCGAKPPTARPQGKVARIAGASPADDQVKMLRDSSVGEVRQWQTTARRRGDAGMQTSTCDV